MFLIRIAEQKMTFILPAGGRRRKRQILWGYFPPISVDDVYLLIAFLDKSGHSPLISEFIPSNYGAPSPPNTSTHLFCHQQFKQTKECTSKYKNNRKQKKRKVILSNKSRESKQRRGADVPTAKKNSGAVGGRGRR